MVMSGHWRRLAVLVAAGVALALAATGCKKEKRPAGGGGGGGGGGAEITPLPELPADTTAVMGFVRTGAPPSAADIRAAAVAITGDDFDDPEAVTLFDACIVPVTAAARRTTLVFLDRVDDDRVVVIGDGSNLRGALEGCLVKVAAAMTDKPQPSRQEGRLTIYPSDHNELVAAWSGADRVVLGISRADVEHVLDTRGRPALADAALAKELAAIDTSAPIWFVAGSRAAPSMASIASIRAQVKGTRAEAHVLFSADGMAEEAAQETAHEVGGAMKVVAQGRELHCDGELAKVLALMGPRGKDAPPPARPPLDDKHVRTLVASGPMMLALFLVGGGSSASSKPAAATTAPPAVAVPAPAPVALPSAATPPPPPGP